MGIVTTLLCIKQASPLRDRAYAVNTKGLKALLQPAGSGMLHHGHDRLNLPCIATTGALEHHSTHDYKLGELASVACFLAAEAASLHFLRSATLIGFSSSLSEPDMSTSEGSVSSLLLSSGYAWIPDSALSTL